MPAGYVLTATKHGCPPTETPPADYKNPFRVDPDTGALWVRQCFVGFKYFGAARHNIHGVWPPPIIGDATTPVTPWGAQLSEDMSKGIKVGQYKNITVTNDLDCEIGILLGLDLTTDLITRGDNRVYMGVQGRINGEHATMTSVSTPSFTGTTKHTRRWLTVSANPHDTGMEVPSSPDYDDMVPAPAWTIEPGESMVVSAKLHVQYGSNMAPSGTEHIISSGSAVRVYGYVL